MCDDSALRGSVQGLQSKTCKSCGVACTAGHIWNGLLAHLDRRKQWTVSLNVHSIFMCIITQRITRVNSCSPNSALSVSGCAYRSVATFFTTCVQNIGNHTKSCPANRLLQISYSERGGKHHSAQAMIGKQLCKASSPVEDAKQAMAVPLLALGVPIQVTHTEANIKLVSA